MTQITSTYAKNEIMALEAARETYRSHVAAMEARDDGWARSLRSVLLSLSLSHPRNVELTLCTVLAAGYARARALESIAAGLSDTPAGPAAPCER